MANISQDRVADTTTTSGTGAITLANSPPTGFRTLNSVASTGDTFRYEIAHQTASEWETGIGRYSGSHVFTRETILTSSNSGSAVNFSSGTKDFFITNAARDIAFGNACTMFGAI